MMGQAPCYNSKNLYLLGTFNWWVFWIVRTQNPRSILRFVQPLHYRLIAYISNHDIANFWCPSSINYQPAARNNAARQHRHTLCLPKPYMGCSQINKLVKGNRRLVVVRGRAREPTGEPA